MKSEQSIFKLFLTIDLPKQLTHTKDALHYRFIVDLQDQSKSFVSSQTQNILFFLKLLILYIISEIENGTDLTVKIIAEKTNKIVGSLVIPIPFAINFEPEITVDQQFNFDNEAKINGKYSLYILNVPLFSQNNTSQQKIKQSSTSSTPKNITKKQSKSPPQLQSKNYFSKDSYMQQINKEVNSILSKHNNSLSSKKEKTIDTGIVDESPSRISDRVQVSRTGTIIQSEISPQLMRQYVLEESPLKLNTSKDKEINHRHHQDLSCLYYLDQATLTNQIQIENENLKETIINLHNKIELQQSELVLYQTLEHNYSQLQNQLTNFLKAQELNKSADSLFDKELLKINESLNNRIQVFIENERKYNKQKVDYDVQIQQLNNEIKMLREHLSELSEKQKHYQNQQADLMNLKKQNEDLKQQLIKNVKEYDKKNNIFEKNLDMYIQQLTNKTNQVNESKRLLDDLEKQNKSINFQLKKSQENLQGKGNNQKQSSLVQPSFLLDVELSTKEVQVLKEINSQQLSEINTLTNQLKQLQQHYQQLQNEQNQMKTLLILARQESNKFKETNFLITNQKNKLGTDLKQYQSQLDLEKLKSSTLLNQLKSRNAQLQEVMDREETHDIQIQKLESIIKQTKKLLENQEEQIILLNNQVKELQELRTKQIKENREDQQKMNQLKQLISGMKESNVAYIPMHGDPIDQALSEFVNSVDDPKKLIELIFREKEGQYVIGGKSVHLKTEQGKVFIKIGGGFIGIEEYLDVNLKDKLERIERKITNKTPRNKTPQKSQRSHTSTQQFTQ